MGDIEQLRSKVKRRRETAKVLLDASLLSRHAELEERLAKAIDYDAKHNEPETSRPLAEEIEALEDEIEEAQTEFVFESIGAAAWLDLAAQYPPTKEQKATGAERNPDSFLPAAIAASCVDPEMTLDDASWFAAELSAGEWSKLAYACCLANEGVGDSPKSQLASAILRLTGPSSDTPESEESPVLGSLAEVDEA